MFTYDQEIPTDPLNLEIPRSHLLVVLSQVDVAELKSLYLAAKKYNKTI